MGLRALVLFAFLGLGQANNIDMSCSHIRQFTDGHNTRRMQIATGSVEGHPAASLMNSVMASAIKGGKPRFARLLDGIIIKPNEPIIARSTLGIWDDELAAKAAKWASTGARYHNPDRTVPSGRFSTGENIYWFSTTDRAQKVSPDAALEAWFSELKDWNYGPLTSEDFDGSRPQVGHYTQMVWSDSTHVGCGVAQTQDKQWNNFMVVCNYGPLGNYLGQTPYESGSASNVLTCGADDCSVQYGDKC